MDLVDYFFDSMIIVLPMFGAAVLACLPWTDSEIEESYRFWME